MNLNFSEINREFPIQLRSAFGLLVFWSAHICQSPFWKEDCLLTEVTNKGLYISYISSSHNHGGGQRVPGKWSSCLKWSCSTSIVGKKVSLKYKILEHVRICLIFPPLLVWTHLIGRSFQSDYLHQQKCNRFIYFWLSPMRVSNSITLSTHHPHSLQWLRCGSSHSSCDLPQGPSQKNQSGLWSQITNPAASRHQQSLPSRHLPQSQHLFLSIIHGRFETNKNAWVSRGLPWSGSQDFGLSQSACERIK